MAIEVPLNQIEEKHLVELVTLTVAESDSLEFKAAYDWKVDKTLPEFLKDVSAMANAEGGDIVLGMKEDKDGNAEELSGIPVSDVQGFEKRITAHCANHLSPSLVGVGIQPVPLQNGGYAFVIRIPQSWSAPHMVTFNTDNRFYVRRVRENLKMTVEELRRRFVLGESALSRMRRFREDRVDDLFESIKAKPAPFAHLMMHFLPLRSFVGRTDYDMVPLKESADLSPQAGSGSDWQSYFNFHGIEVIETNAGHRFRRTQIFRNGIVEIAASRIVELQSGITVMNSVWITNVIFQRARYGLRLLKSLNILPPVFVGISLVRVKDVHLKYSASAELRGPMDGESLKFDEIALGDDPDALRDNLKPMFSILAQSFGLSEWPWAPDNPRLAQ